MIQKDVEALQEKITRQIREWNPTLSVHHLQSWTEFPNPTSEDQRLAIGVRELEFKAGDRAVLWAYNPKIDEPYSGRYAVLTIGNRLKPEIIEQYNVLIPEQAETIGVEPGYGVWEVTLIDVFEWKQMWEEADPRQIDGCIYLQFE